MTPDQEKTVKRIKQIADSALAKLNRLNIKSSNKFWTSNREEVGRKLGQQRSIGYSSYEDVVKKVQVSRVGNCGEKGMTFGWFASQHPDAKGLGIYTVAAVDWDHMWAVITEDKLTDGDTYKLSDLGTTGIVLDGWSEDWYFPNVGRLDKILLDIWRMATPFAFWVQGKVEADTLKFKVNGVIQDP